MEKWFKSFILECHDVHKTPDKREDSSSESDSDSSDGEDQGIINI